MLIYLYGVKAPAHAEVDADNRYNYYFFLH